MVYGGLNSRENNPAHHSFIVPRQENQSISLKRSPSESGLARNGGGAAGKPGGPNPKFMSFHENTSSHQKNHGIMTKTALGSFNYNDVPKLEPSKCSSKRNGLIAAYAANTHQGIIRNYNEDRVSIILNMVKPGVNYPF